MTAALRSRWTALALAVACVSTTGCLEEPGNGDYVGVDTYFLSEGWYPDPNAKIRFECWNYRLNRWEGARTFLNATGVYWTGNSKVVDGVRFYEWNRWVRIPWGDCWAATNDWPWNPQAVAAFRAVEVSDPQNPTTLPPSDANLKPTGENNNRFVYVLGD